MHKTLMVIRREYLDRVRKKSFWIGTLLFPVIMVAMLVVPILLAGATPDNQRKIAVIDSTDALFDSLNEELGEYKLKNGDPMFVLEKTPAAGDPEGARKALEPRVENKELFAILVIGPKLEDESNYALYGKHVTNEDITGRIRRGLEKAVIARRLVMRNLAVDRATLGGIIKRVELETYQITQPGKASKKDFMLSYLGTFGFVIILFMSMLLYGIAVMRGILEEKSNRIMEVLLASLTPDQLMTGKIIGIGLVGLTQMSVYLLASVAMPMVVSASGPRADMMKGILEAVSPLKMIYFVIFFLLGYFMYTALFAAVGAVCNSEQEAQNLQAPVQSALMLPMFATIYFVFNPDTKFSVVASLIPLFTPMVMFMRISLLPFVPLWQIALSILLTLATIYLLFRAVAKIFRIGILMYGKRPTVPEIFRWARS